MDVNPFAQLVRRARLDAGLGLREAARLLEISAPYLQDVEAGRRFPSAPVLGRFVALLNLDHASAAEAADSARMAERLRRLAADQTPATAAALRRAADQLEGIAALEASS